MWTVFHWAANSKRIELFQGVFNLAKKILTIGEVKKLLLATRNKRWTVFHSAANSNNIEVLQEVFNLAKKSNIRGGTKIPFFHR